MKTIGIAFMAAILGAALGWSTALVNERGTAPADADEMYRRMAAALDNRLDTVERSYVLARLCTYLDENNLEGAIRAFTDRSTMPSLTAWDTQVFFAAWAKIEGEAILDPVRGWGEDRFNRIALAAVVTEYARAGEFERAKDLYLSMPGSMRSAATGPLFASWAETAYYDDLIEVLLSFPNGEERQTTMNILAGQILRRSGEEALIEWVEGLETPGPDLFKFKAYESAVRALAIQSPEKAIEWVLANWAKDEDWSRRGVEFVVEVWRRTEPGRAIDWALSVETETAQKRKIAVRAAMLVLDRWVITDPEEAGIWLMMRESEPWHDKFNEQLSAYYSIRAPRQSIVFANRIHNKKRFANAERILRRELRNFPQKEELFAMLGPDGPKILTLDDMRIDPKDAAAR